MKKFAAAVLVCADVSKQIAPRTCIQMIMLTQGYAK